VSLNFILSLGARIRFSIWQSLRAMSKSGSENGDDPGAGTEMEREFVPGLDLDSERRNMTTTTTKTLPAPTFRALERLIVDSEDLLPAGPVGVDYGVLENGLHYYVRKNAKPKERAALALGVKVGCVD